MEYFDILLIAIEILAAILLYIAAGAAVKHLSNKWRILYVIPAVIFMVIGAIKGTDISMTGTYIGSLIMLAGFIKDSVKIRRTSCIISAALCLVSIPVCMLNKGYRSPDYAEDFEKAFSTMKKHYVLTEHKGIDWDSLYKEYQPQFAEADRNHDKTANYIAWCKFCAEFNDCHVSYMPDGYNNDEEFRELAVEATEYMGIKDYGFSMMILSDGKTVAVNVAEDSIPALNGIHNGTVITSWNGMTTEEAAELSPLFDNITFADKDNKKFFYGLFASALCQDSVNMSYIDDDGNERSLEVPVYKDGNERFYDTSDILCKGVDMGHFQWKEIDEKTVCLRLKMMMYDSESNENSDYSNMKITLKQNLQNYLDSGYTNLIIDMRNNGGGDGRLVMALGELLGEKGEHYYSSDALWSDKTGGYIYNEDTQKYAKACDNYFTGEDIWCGNPIVILVNSNSVSAADHCAMIMSGMKNVTVMGFTEPNGSAQGVGIVNLESGYISFSGSLMLNQDGTVFIDSGKDFESGDDADIIIPFDEDAVNAIFSENRDYALEKALEFIYEMN